MLKLLITKELKQIILSNKFAYSFGICSLLVLLTFYVGARNYTVSRDQYNAAVQENIRGMDGITDWRMIDHRIFLPPQPLASLVAGVSNDIGRNIEMHGRGELKPEDSKYAEDPIYAAFRFLDLNFLFQVILSLFAILLVYNAVNGEKEMGTLRLAFSNSIPRDKFIIAKIAGSFIALCLPLLIPFLIGALLLPVLGVPVNSGQWLKLVFIIAAGFIYFGVFLSLSVFVSTITKSSSNSFLFLLVIWILAVIIIPRAAVLISGRAVDVPSIDDINSKKSAFAQQVGNETMNAMRDFKPDPDQDMMKQFNEFMEKINSEQEEKQQVFNEKLNEQRRNAQEVQENLATNISRVSPASCFTLAATNLAGTSLELVRNYRDQANAYQQKFADFQREKEGMTTGGSFMFIMRKVGDEEPEEIDPSELPEFVYQPPTLAETISLTLPDFGLLLLFNLIFFAASYVSFLKFDLR